MPHDLRFHMQMSRWHAGREDCDINESECPFEIKKNRKSRACTAQEEHKGKPNWPTFFGTLASCIISVQPFYFITHGNKGKLYISYIVWQPASELELRFFVLASSMMCSEFLWSLRMNACLVWKQCGNLGTPKYFFKGKHNRKVSQPKFR